MLLRQPRSLYDVHMLHLDSPGDMHRFLRELRKQAAPLGLDSSKPTGKQYPRMPQIPLPEIEPLSMGLTDAIRARTSLAETVATPRSLSLSTCSQLLGNAVAARGTKRGYPSGGGLQPIEMYVVGPIAEHDPAVYHFLPSTHSLEMLWPVGENAGQQLLTGTGAIHGTHTLILTARWAVSAKKYAGFAYYLSLLEAGHLAQNLLLCATALNISARVIAGFDDTRTSELLDLLPGEEDPVYFITFVPPKK